MDCAPSPHQRECLAIANAGGRSSSHSSFNSREEALSRVTPNARGSYSYHGRSFPDAETVRWIAEHVSLAVQPCPEKCLCRLEAEIAELKAKQAPVAAKLVTVCPD